MNVSYPSGAPHDDASGVPGDDAYWQRPDPGREPPRPAAPASPPGPSYAGPPRTSPPPPGWRPPVVPQPPPPRELPPQNLPRLDDAEGSARTVTYGVGMVAAAIGLILMFLLCARVIF